MGNFWTEGGHANDINVEQFRANNQYLWQPDDYPYEDLVKKIDAAGDRCMLESLGEDGSFGCTTKQVDGLIVSRDLIDSILEIEFLRSGLPEGFLNNATVLDIGAGYGRLAHRLSQLYSDIRLQCTDSIPVSRAVCHKYLSARGVKNAEVIDPADLHTHPTPNLVMNIHSWSECTNSEIMEWVEHIADRKIQWLYVVPHGPQFHSSGGEFRSVIERRYELFKQDYFPPDAWSRWMYLWKLKQ